MNRLRVIGGTRLAGRVFCQGAKNSVLPILAGCLLTGGETCLSHVPRLRDVEATLNILQQMGCTTEWQGNDLLVNSAHVTECNISEELMRELRSSAVLLGAAIARCGKTEVGRPGGCELGPRPIDLHIGAFRRLGVWVSEEGSHISCKAEKIRGCALSLPFPSVGATENIMLIAATAEGITTLTGAAREPEIIDLQNFLNHCGARISGAGSNQIVIEGVKKLHPCYYTVMPDRIVAATYLSAAAATGGNIRIEKILPVLVEPVLESLERSGCVIVRNADSIELSAPEQLVAIPQTITAPYPGFPTDAVAPLMGALLRAKGDSHFQEGIFENRYRHVDPLLKMGAKISVSGKEAVIRGVPVLYGAEMEATDLRGGAALVLAAMQAEGESVITETRLIERGYENFSETLSALGAQMIKE